MFLSLHRSGCGWFSKHGKSTKVDSVDGLVRTFEACTSISFVLYMYLLKINKRYRLKVRVKLKLHMVVVKKNLCFVDSMKKASITPFILFVQ